MCNNKMEMELFGYFETSMWLDTHSVWEFPPRMRIKGSLILFLSPKYRKPPTRARTHKHTIMHIHKYGSAQTIKNREILGKNEEKK